MEEAAVIEIAYHAILVLLKLALPILLVALIVGLIISLFQALTQIQEPTISFVPKLIAIFVTLALMLPYFGKVMSSFTEEIVSNIVNIK
ncbi:Flagellar biosynthetic protein FliQ [Alphaproteobacteria bacterium]